MAGRTGRRSLEPRKTRAAGRSLRSALRRLDAAAGRANPFLMLIVIGLLVLNVSCFTALKLARSPFGGPLPNQAVGLSGPLPVPYNR
jgi:hypothetical protein